MKNSKKQICLLSLLVSSNLFASDYATNNLTVTNKYILEALFLNGKNKAPTKEENSTTSPGDPIYNLFYLSRAIATNTNTLEALGYLNYLAQNSKKESLLFENIKKILITNTLKDSLQDEVIKKIQEYLKNGKKYNGEFSIKNLTFHFYINNQSELYKINEKIINFRKVEIVNNLKTYYTANKENLKCNINISTFNKDAVENIVNLKDSIDENIIAKENLKQIYDDIIKIYNVNKLPGKLLESKPYLLKDYVNFLNSYNEYYIELKQKRDSLIFEYSSNLIDDTFNNFQNQDHLSAYNKTIGITDINSKIKESRTVIQETNNEISGFKVPSQSDLINSVAQFMANRAKQETMIWFVQYLQKEIQNPLLWDAFPETKEMLEMFDLDRIKDLNENWRTSLSSDFVKMPTNIINSQWLANQAVKHGRKYELEVIQSSVKSVTYFQKLVSERNNYRSILKHFYEQSNDSELFKNQKNLKDITTLLYIVSNEFYTIQDKKMYYVTSEQLNNISDEQWKYFLDLVEIKYGLEDKNIFTKILGNKFDDNDRKKFVNLISDFSQIHALSKAAMDENHPSFNLAWNKMIDLLKYVDPQYDSVNNIFNSETYPEINQLQSLYKIGQQISRKDFKAATKGTLEFIKPLYTNFNFNIEVEDNKLLICNILNQRPIEILNIDKFKKSDIQLNDFTISFDKYCSGYIVINDLYFTVRDIKNEIKSAQFQIENNNTKDLFLSKDSFLSIIFKPIKIDKNKIKTEEINKRISNSLLLANLIVDLADNPLKVLNNNNYEIFDIELEDIQGNLQNRSIEKLLKTSMLFTDIFNARDEKGVYNAIEDMFSPKESYMIKRKHKRTFSVNGYVGLYGGYQFVQSQPSDYTNSFAYGITAPIGLTYSGKKIGVFVQFLELGNVVNHYLWSNADYSHKQKLSVKELFSPGLKVLYNIPKTPFVAFVGSSLVQVDKHYNDRMEIVNDRAFDLVQVTAGVKVDIPFFTMYKSNKSKKKKF